MQTLREIFRANGHKIASRLKETHKNPEIRLAFYQNAATSCRVSSTSFPYFLEQFAQNYRVEKSPLVRRAMLNMYKAQINFKDETPQQAKGVQPAKIEWGDVVGLGTHYKLLSNLLADCWRTTPLTEEALSETEFPLMQAALHTLAAAPDNQAYGLFDRITDRITQVIKIAGENYVFGLQHDAIQIAKRHLDMVCDKFLRLNIAVLNLERAYYPPHAQQYAKWVSTKGDDFLPPHIVQARAKVDDFNCALLFAYDAAAEALYGALPSEHLHAVCNDNRRLAFMNVPKYEFRNLVNSATQKYGSAAATFLYKVHNAVEELQPPLVSLYGEVFAQIAPTRNSLRTPEWPGLGGWPVG